jgi:hypothetical protein
VDSHPGPPFTGRGPIVHTDNSPARANPAAAEKHLERVHRHQEWSVARPPGVPTLTSGDESPVIAAYSPNSVVREFCEVRARNDAPSRSDRVGDAGKGTHYRGVLSA